MELTKTKTKYKQTEVGLIPEDWELVPFDSIFSFYSTSNYSKAQMSEDDEVGCLHYGLIHAIKNTNYDLKNGVKYYVTSEQAKYELIRDGDVIMVDASEDLEGINKSVEVFGVGNNKYISGLHTYLLRDKKSLLADNFRGIILNSQSVKNQMLQLAVGMKVFGVSKTQLVKVKLPLPPLPEQKAIAQVLSDTDTLIQTLEQKLAKKRAIKQGAMQQLLTPKEDWEVRKLGEICEVFGRIGFRGYTKGDIVPKGKGAIALSPSNIINNELSFIKNTYISWLKYDESPEIKINVGDIVLVKTASIGKTALVKHLPEKATLNPQLVVFKNIKVNNIVLSYIMKEKFFQDQIRLSMVGGVLSTLSQEYIKNFSIPLPKSVIEQTRIATILSDMDAEIGQLEQKLDKYKLLKQGLMQELLTGRIRLV